MRRTRIQHFVARPAVGLDPARDLPEHFLRPGGRQRLHLGGDALAVGRDVGLAVNHGQTYGPDLCKRKAPCFQGSRFFAYILTYAMYAPAEEKSPQERRPNRPHQSVERHGP